MLINKSLKILPLILLSLLISCSDDDKIIDGVQNDITNGAVLRTLSVNNATLNSSEADSEFSVTVEEQDVEDGDLMESVSILVTFNDLTPDNGTTVAENVFIKEIPASAFSEGPQGLPVATLTATFGEAVAAMGLTAEDHAPGDVLVIELSLKLTDGRIFDSSSAGGIITGGFFASPFRYNALILCSPQAGDYVVDMHDSFGDGWQTDDGNGGSGITIDVDGTIIEIGMCSPYGGSNVGTFNGGDECTAWPDDIGDPTSDYHDATATVTIPEGAGSAIWSFPGDFYGEISFEVYGPDGTLLFAGAQGETGPGLLPITACAATE